MSRTITAQAAPWQELRLNSLVHCRDGPAGVLSQVHFYPCCGALAQLVIRRSLFAHPRRVVVPVMAVDAVADEHITLNLTQAALDTFPADTSSLLRALGADWRTTQASLSSAPAAPAHNAGRCAQTGAHNAIGLLSKAMPVECEDGRAGRLASVLLDPHTLRVLHLVVRRGMWIQRTATVPLAWIASIDAWRIRLGVRRSRLVDLPPYHSDEEIAEDVRYALRMTSAFRSYAEWMALGVTVHNGVVLLHGNVRSRAQRNEAERIAQQTLSVRHVCNELAVDDELARQIGRALHTHTRLGAPTIAPTVELGVVELMGEIRRPEQVSRALETVRQIRGVRQIHNRLRVSTPGDRVSTAAVCDSVVVQRWSHPAAPGRPERDTAIRER